MALPMGLTCSARIFTRVALFIGSRLRRQGVRMVLYIDDLLVIAVSLKECERHVSLLLEAIEEFGFLLNEKKSNLEPAQIFTYLGLVWDTISWKVGIKPEREAKIRDNAKQLIDASSATCRLLAAFLGRTASSAGAIPLAKVRVRRLQWDFLSSCYDSHLFDSYMTITEEAKEELKFWKDLPEGLSSPITLSPASGTVTTDASDSGLGIWYDGEIVSEPIPEVFLNFHINVKELFALQ